MPQGVIKTLHTAGHYGFITADGESADLYFRGTSVGGAGFDALRVGQRVEFDATPDPLKLGRLRAEQIQPAQ